MRLKKEVKLGLLVLVAFILIIGVSLFIKSNYTDAAKFKREYEKINGVKVKGTKYRYQKIDIRKKNAICYSTLEEVVDLFKNKETALIFLGSSRDATSRLVASSLLKAASEFPLDKIYYVDIEGLTDEFEIQDGMVEKTKEGDAKYQELLIFLDSVLDNYVVKDEDGVEYESDYKKINAPFVFTIKYGRVVNFHIGAVEIKEDQSIYDPLTESQNGELFAIFEALIETISEKKSLK